MQHWFKSLLNSFQKKSHTHSKKLFHIPSPLSGVPLWNPKSFHDLADEGYCQNVIVYRSITLIARNLASVPWRIQENGRILDTHPLLDLINAPNPSQTKASFLESLVSYLLLSGNSYAELVSGREQPLELYLLRPDRVQIIPNDGDDPTYVYSVGEKRRTIKKNPDSCISPILHLKLFHPLNDWYGLSPIEAAAPSIEHHNEVGRHNLSLLQNGGRPTGALILGDKALKLPEEEYQALREELASTLKGSTHAGEILFLAGDMKWQEMGASPKDLDFIEGKLLAAREIAQAYGVPAMLVGVPGDATFANYKEARLHLWEDTILPLLDKIISEMNRWLCPLYGDQIKFTYDLESIPALVMRREALWARLESCSFLTENEKREALGYGQRESA
jgi:HK97 family phage portal protein